MKTKLKKIAVCLFAALLLISSLSVAFAARTGSLCVIVTDEDDIPVPDFTVVLCKVSNPDGILFTEFSPAGISASSLLNEKNNAKNAKKLRRYADNVSGEVRITDHMGSVGYEDLSEGVYLVYSPAGQGCIFTPFLVYMPTMIGDEAHYDLISTPKVEDEGGTPPGGGGGGGEDPVPTPTPTTTPTPTPGDEPTPSPGPSDPVDPSDPPVGPTPPGGGGEGGGEEPGTPGVPGGGEGGEGEEEPGIPTLPLTGVERRPIWILLGLGVALIIVGVFQLGRRREKA